jgi:iron complex outermembrane receptor protein/outer membrane receptor for ferrienterochelin and colicins
MSKYFFVLAILACSFAYGQNTFKAVIKNGETNDNLIGATAQLVNSSNGAITNEQGYLEIKNIPNVVQEIKFSSIGFETKLLTFTFPVGDTLLIKLFQKEETELDEVVIQSTRTNRTIKNTPTRIETIDGEELDEKGNMKPANVSMVLHESTGLQVQQTSATSGNASIRVQGLDGRYTQLLKDGYPNFGNFASGLSILEIPPLDLKQVEVIKGPASTLYGGGAIAGVVNFISKTPNEKRAFNFMLNQSNIGQSNIGAYSSQRKGKFGYAVLGLVNFQKSYDVDNDDFSEVPKSNNFTINPRLFFYPNKSTTIMIGNSFMKGEMKGGDMHVIAGKSDSNHTYFEQNQTLRNTTTFEFDKKFNNKNNFKLKQSLSFFDRKINIPNYGFSGSNVNAFTDASYMWQKEKHTIIGGINLLYDKFNQKNTGVLNTTSFTEGAYIQHTWDITENIKLENGLRLDHLNFSNPIFSKNQTFLLPRISTLFKINNHWSSRIGGGLGYKIPTIFTEQTETMQYQQINALNNVEAEKSIGGTFDINYKGEFIKDLMVSVNQLFFLTEINKPLVLLKNSNNYFFSNSNKNVISKGFETNVKFIYKEDFKLFIGYTFTDAKANYLQGNQYLPLLPKSKLNLALIYEKENNFKTGFEGYFTDNQYLYNGTKTPTFWEFGFMAEKTLRKYYSIFINFENFTDTRQSRYKRVVNGSNASPSFDDIWTHTEGFTFNGGIKIKF